MAPSPAAPIVSLRGVGKLFGTGTLALDGLDLDVREGEFLSLLGPSGCGKSTALRIIAGLSEPTRGTVAWRDGERRCAPRHRLRVPGADPDALGDGVRQRLPAAEARPAWTRPPPRRASWKRWRASAWPTSREAYPRELSGGMRMRVSIARALVTAPRILLMDEPFAALDEITRFKLNDDLVALWRELRMTVVFVTHSVFELVFLSNRIVVMTSRPGRVSSELAIDAPVRDANFRTSAEYAGYCRVASEALGTGHARACGSGGMNETRAPHPCAPRRAFSRLASCCGTSSSASTAFRPTSCRRPAWC